MDRLRKLDAYPKINEDFYSRTFSGGLITLLSSLVMLFLFASEFSLYLHTVKETKLLVDTSRGETLRINFDVTFPAIPCSLLSLDAMDIMGEQHFDIKHNITKKRINEHGHILEVKKDGIGAPKIGKPLQKHGGRLDHGEAYCGSCYGADTSDEHCCNSCEEVREAYRSKGWALNIVDEIDQCKREGFIQAVKDEQGEGCNMYGSLEVNKVAGNFHFAPGKSLHHSHFEANDVLNAIHMYNISHTINKLSFGDYFPGVINPLDGSPWVHEKPNGVQQYFLKVVPTVYAGVRGNIVSSNQYSVTEHFKKMDFARLDFNPGVFFIYDFSPIKVVYEEHHYPFLHFMTNICAVVGGVFTVAGIVDSFIYHGQKAMKKKLEIGKLR
ncbi:Endoplasmic reticulum-Golgi intermediate compartment protein 3 [Euphorbia peplus]|nr:Endoplasmic reticulum-Golgi intermediate compartment protein 3 [Euphorbia peplus]